MQINKQALELLKGSNITSRVIIQTMEQICEANSKFGAGDTQIHLDYQSSESVVKPGDMFPFITIGLRCGVTTEEKE